MSKIDISTHIQNRNDFIEQFQREHGYTNRTLNSNINLNNSNLTTNASRISRSRWDYLHDLNKLQKVKLDEKRKLVKKEEEEQIMNQCTFSPKLNKSANYGNLTINTDNNEIHILDMIQRQELWKNKQKERMDNLKKIEKEKEMKQCFFTPEINKENSLNKSHITYKATNLLEDPESYQMYIKRMQKKRDDDINKKKIEEQKPGSGKIWNSNPKNYDLKYDYTKHQISKSNNNKLYRSKSNPKLNSSKTSNNTKISYSNLDQGKFYEGIYKKVEKNFHTNYNKENEHEDNILFTQTVEYGKAIEILHNELLSINLLNDDDEEIENNYMQ
jgi:hypothetical protein